MHQLQLIVVSYNENQITTYCRMQCHYGENKCENQGHSNKKDIESTVMSRWREEVKENP